MISTSAPPGFPMPGSSSEPTAGKRKAASFEVKESFSVVPVR
jgi:hypothetical protein